ncbi:hypothetical protein RJ639_038406 [Escallonia herrerae]|uniref:Reverse transcriptase RNase H-like domain-containing protein n=1 Tax=Escallonia herrerae TaxID=1293975 RepID=A0AA89B7H2_9ASTE|nr:hypothetical protein RJ639_038406 [Escallonia herrerae]
MKRVVVDNGSSAEVLFYDAFKKINIPTYHLQKMDTPLCGFSNHPVTVEGVIALPVVVGTPLRQANLMLDFVVELTGRVAALGRFMASEVAVSTILVREENGIQKPIYYVSKVLQNVETRYPKIDKVALALITSARNLPWTTRKTSMTSSARKEDTRLAPCVAAPFPKHKKVVDPVVASALLSFEEDKEVVKAIIAATSPFYSFESKLGDYYRADAIRMEALQRTTGKSLDGLPLVGLQLPFHLGQCWEMPDSLLNKISAAVIGSKLGE